jgi:dipeptidyl aminopeptidase/acylaminoacyl peptidase
MPLGRLVPEAAIQAELTATGGAIEEVPTPFPGSRVFVPRDGRKTHPAVLFLHGSEGGASGVNEWFALQWAKKGFVTMAYAYYGAAGTPTGIGRVSLDQAFDAARWMRSSPMVDGQKLALYGASRGGEMAIALASAPEASSLISAVVAHSPMDRAARSLTVNRAGEWQPVVEHGALVPSWQHNGDDMPDGHRFTIERFPGPVFVTVGQDDRDFPMWGPEGTEAIQRSRAGHSGDVFHIIPGERHLLSPPVQAAMEAERLAFLERWLAAPSDADLFADGDGPAETAALDRQ